MKKRSGNITRRLTALMLASVLFTMLFSSAAQANILDDAKKKLIEWDQQFHVTQTLKDTWDTASKKVHDLIFSYDMQPDDDILIKLAESWAITEYLTGAHKGEPWVYYFDNSTNRMVEDPTGIGKGYNKKKTPAGSSLSGVRTGIIQATVMNAASCKIEWVNYNDAVNAYLLAKMEEKNAKKSAETETEPE